MLTSLVRTISGSRSSSRCLRTFPGTDYASILCKADVEPLIVTKTVGNSDYRTTEDPYTHICDETLKMAAVNMADVFKKRVE